MIRDILKINQIARDSRLNYIPYTPLFPKMDKYASTHTWDTTMPHTRAIRPIRTIRTNFVFSIRAYSEHIAYTIHRVGWAFIWEEHLLLLLFEDKKGKNMRRIYLTRTLCPFVTVKLIFQYSILCLRICIRSTHA